MGTRSLPKYVCQETNRHGKRVLYFRRKSGARRRLPSDPRSVEFADAYRAAIEGAAPRPIAKDVGPTLRQRIDLQMRGALVNARLRARKRNLSFDLDLRWVLAEIEMHDLHCPLTGIRFFYGARKETAQHPYAPSIDRIDPKRGYTKDNCRIVVYAINVMLHDWGPAVFERVVAGYRSRRRASG